MSFKIQDTIIYEDSHIILCHKPPGIPVQSAHIGVMDMESALKNYMAKNNLGKIPYIGVVHRLDQPVEGLIVFAKTSKGAAALTRQITQGTMVKKYLAITQGIPRVKKDSLTHYLRKDGKKNISQVVKNNTVGGKKAMLDYEVLEVLEDSALVEILLYTGRHHQIRVQMAAIDCPLKGDRKYGDEKCSERESLSLCACFLSFTHPQTGKVMEFRVKPRGEEFQKYKLLS